MHRRTPKLARLLLAVGILILGYAIGPFQPVAHAIVSGCRSDPLVILSDGTVLDVSVAIDTAVSDVTEIHYTIHGPVGTAVVAVVTTPTIGFAGKETFTYYADTAPKEYVTEALVHTVPNQIAVTSYTTFAQTTIGYSSQLTLQYKTITGVNGQVLRASLKR